jgi:carbamoyltransferase
MTIVGLGGLLNDPAAVVVRDGALASAVEQKKVARRFRAGELPAEALQSALELARADAARVDIVAVARPFARGAETSPHLELRDLFPAARVVVLEHHLAHAASAYYGSPFDQATVLTLDGAGDFLCGARWRASGGQLAIERELYYPDSLGGLYERVTAFLGFEPRADEHKVQWLSAGAAAEFEDVFLEMVQPRASDGLRLNREWFDNERPGHGGFGARLYTRLGLEEGRPVPDTMKPRIAASFQRAVERVVAGFAGQGENLCLAGGLHLNPLLVASLERSGAWKNVFVQPAAGNSGTALGAALWAWRNTAGQTARVPLSTLALGPSFAPEAIKQVLENCKLRFRVLLTTGELLGAAVELLAQNRILAWMQDRMEFGPRALGNRSILASPLDPYSTENLNVYIKHREPFRKFAASVPEERMAEFFEAGPNARFLATVGRVRPEYRKTFAAAVMGDGLIRVHAVAQQENPLFHRLLLAWGEKTGMPVLYNTSFNLFGDPLVCTPRDAVRSFYSSGIDAMLVGHFLLEK